MWVLRWANQTWRESDVTVADAATVCQLASSDRWAVLDPRTGFGALTAWLTLMELRDNPRPLEQIRAGLSIRMLSEMLESITTEGG